MSAWTTKTEESVTQTSSLDNGYDILSWYKEVKQSGASDPSNAVPITGKGSIQILISREDEMPLEALDGLLNAVEAAVNALPNPNA